MTMTMAELVQYQSTSDAEDFLEHFGIKGMKWGIRREPSAERTAARTQRFERRAERGQETVRAANAFNSPSVAIGMKAAALVMTGITAGMAIKSLRNPSPGAFRRIKMGMTAVGVLMTGVQATSIARDIGDISAYKKKEQGGGPR